MELRVLWNLSRECLRVKKIYKKFHGKYGKTEQKSLPEKTGYFMLRIFLISSGISRRFMEIQPKQQAQARHPKPP